MFDLVSTNSNVFRIWYSCRSVMSTLIVMTGGMILSAKTHLSFKFFCLFWSINCCIFDNLNYLFESFVFWPGVDVCSGGFRRWGVDVWLNGLYFHVKGVGDFHMIVFDLINFLFDCCLMFGFVFIYFPLTLLLTLTFLIWYPKDQVILERCF